MNPITLRRIGTMLAAAGLLVVMQYAAVAQMGEYKSLLKPNMVYTTTQNQTISGNNGGVDMQTLYSAQKFRIETGAEKSGSFSVKLTAYESARGKTATADKAVTVIEFEATTNGTLRNFKQVAGEGTVAASVAPMVAAQYLEGIMLITRYKLDRKIKRTYNITGSSVKGNIASVKFTWDEISPSGVDEPNLVTKRTGTAKFDTQASMYVQSETVKTSDISVPDDANGPGKQVRMLTTVVHTTDIRRK